MFVKVVPPPEKSSPVLLPQVPLYVIRESVSCSVVFVIVALHNRSKVSEKTWCTRRSALRFNGRFVTLVSDS